MSLAFVLRHGAAGDGAVTFPGFPGVWTPGEPIEAQVFVDAGVFASTEEMQDRAAEVGVPLETTTVAAGSAPMPERDNHVSNAAEAAVQAGKSLEEMSHRELDAKAATLGLDLPDVTKAEKVALIDAVLNPDANAAEADS